MNHTTVLLKEAVDALVTIPEGRYVDCTYGRGGHSREILSRLSDNGRLLVIDKDIEAVAHARQSIGTDARVQVVHGSFSELSRIVEEQGFGLVHGLLMDLGVSSPQIDSAERGFSFTHEGPLDMRMNQAEGETVADWLAQATEAEISRVLWDYGEERFARRIARRIVEQRNEMAITSTSELVALIEAAIPFRDKHKHPATRSFQALRIFINSELMDLKACLGEVIALLVVGGRLVVISFHSLEDRIVKRFIREKEKGDPFPRKLPVKNEMLRRELASVGKAVKPAKEEIANNPRARSAVMRVACKLAVAPMGQSTEMKA
jgi:16S rRNA (cytosine1402-N4)-methyltransferase